MSKLSSPVLQSSFFSTTAGKFYNGKLMINTIVVYPFICSFFHTFFVILLGSRSTTSKTTTTKFIENGPISKLFVKFKMSSIIVLCFHIPTTLWPSSYCTEMWQLPLRKRCRKLDLWQRNLQSPLVPFYFNFMPNIDYQHLLGSRHFLQFHTTGSYIFFSPLPHPAHHGPERLKCEFTLLFFQSLFFSARCLLFEYNYSTFMTQIGEAEKKCSKRTANSCCHLLSLV